MNAGAKPLHAFLRDFFLSCQKTILPPHFFGLAQRNGCGAPKKNAGRRPEAERAFSKREVAAKWSSREVNDVSHQNRALLPAVAATLRVEAERRFAAGVPSISRQCRERSEANARSAMLKTHSPLGMGIVRHRKLW